MKNAKISFLLKVTTAMEQPGSGKQKYTGLYLMEFNGFTAPICDPGFHHDGQEDVPQNSPGLKMTRMPIQILKIFANESMDKGLISKIYTHLIQLNTKKQKTKKRPNQKMGRDLNRRFSKERHTDGQKST